MVKNIGNIRTRKLFKKSQKMKKIKRVIIKKIGLTSKKIVEKTAVTDVNREKCWILITWKITILVPPQLREEVFEN